MSVCGYCNSCERRFELNRETVYANKTIDFGMLVNLQCPKCYITKEIEQVLLVDMGISHSDTLHEINVLDQFECIEELLVSVSIALKERE